MKIAFVLSNRFAPRPITPSKMHDDPRGLTGSELSFLKFSQHMAMLGHDVTAFSNFTEEAILIGGARLSDVNTLGKRRSEDWDAAIAWIDPSPIYDFNAQVKVLNQQVNDFGYCPGWEKHINVLTSPSYAHMKHLRSHTEYSRTWSVLYNGTDGRRLNLMPLEGRSRKMVYASSPDRGLHWALELFPKIKRRVPDAELTICYDWDELYRNVRSADNEFGYRVRYCHEMVERLKGKGVTHLKGVSRNNVLDIMDSSRVLCYPCDTMSFTEGFSVTTIDALSQGCLPVITDIDALGEVYGGHVPVVPSPVASHKDEYVELVIAALTDDAFYDKHIESSTELFDRYGWKKLAGQLEEMIKCV